MRTVRYILLLLLPLIGCASLFTSCVEGDIIDETPTNNFTTTRRIAVFVPKDEMDQMKAVADWALENINIAQRGLPTQVKIELDWHNESTDKRTFHPEYQAVLSSNSTDAVIGPMTSYYANEAYDVMGYNSDIIKPVIFPTATSFDLQRLNSTKKQLWFMSENDITQSQVLVTLATQMATKSNDRKVCLIYSDDVYGKSYHEWIPFICSQLGTKFYKEAEIPSTSEDCEQRLASAMNAFGDDVQIIIASSQKQHYIVCDSLLSCGALQLQHPENVQLIASDVALNQGGVSRYHRMWGAALAPKPAGGFQKAYRSRMGQELMATHSEVYDAVMFLFYGFYIEALKQETPSKSDGAAMYDYLCRVVDGKDENSPQCGWTTSGIRTALLAYQNGRSPQVNGCTNEWAFTNRFHTSVSNSYYLIWNCINQQLTHVTYLTSDTSGKNTSINEALSWCGLPDEAEIPGPKDYGQLGEKWALLVAGSSAYDPKTPNILGNYRHQADVLAMYHMLRNHGYEDDHIVMIMEDDIVSNDTLNLYPGEVRNQVGGDNLYKDIPLDSIYRLSWLNKHAGGYGAIYNILSGYKDDKYPELQKLLHSGYNDDVFIYWSGHGTSEGRLKWLEEEIPEGAPSQWLSLMKCRKAIIFIESCYSGKVGEYIAGYNKPGLLCITAASNENSYADKAEMDPKMKTYLSDKFSSTLIQTLDAQPDISLFNLYIKLAASTCDSRVQVYGIPNYGSLYSNNMLDFLDKK